jgi:hypothetical protein
LKPEIWDHIERHKINPEFDMAIVTPNAYDFEVEKISKIGEEEKIINTKDLTFWERKWDVEGIRKFVRAILPPKADGEEIRDERIEELYGELEGAMGGKGALRKISWPVVLILASRK